MSQALAIRGLAVGFTLVSAGGCVILDTDLRAQLVGKTWVEETREMHLPLDQALKLAVKTHNGAIRVSGDPAQQGATVVLRLRAGGRDEEDARACLEALGVDTPRWAGTQRLQVDWQRPRRSNWSMQADLDIVMPANLELNALTHNGAILVQGLQRGCTLETHNGRIEAADVAEQLQATTHNGRITARVQAPQLRLQSHNGRIEVEIGGTPAVEGSISTYNGSIRLALEPDISTTLDCRTRDGRIKNQLPGLEAQRSDSQSLRASLGDGGRALTVRSDHGNIELLAEDL